MKRILWVLCVCALLLAACPTALALDPIGTVIELSSVKSEEAYTHSATIGGSAVKEYDYVWHADPATAHDEVKNSPAEYHTGEKPSGEDAVYIAHDIYYYPLLEQSKFKQVNYDGESEWVYMYEAKGYENYIFSTLPTLRTGFPSQMMHSAEEAYQNAVLHITKPGTYILTGEWHGQVRVDLGEDSSVDDGSCVTLILDTVTIECTVASGIVFDNVYECDVDWEERESHSPKANTDKAGANIVLADGSVNKVVGTNIFRMLKTQYKDEDSADTYPVQKKRLKVDGAVYSYQSLNISGQKDGSGTLNIESGFEGLNSELHLTMNGGNVNIFSQDDGINVNEDGVSVLTVNGGNLHICAGLGAEGDGIDSNGFVVVNGGTLISAANPAADSGLDSDCGSYVNGGTVVALGSTMDWAKSGDMTNQGQAILNLRFGGSQSSDEAIVITDTNDAVLFAYDPDKDTVSGAHVRSYSGAVISSPDLAVGDTCRIYVGGEVSGEQENGVYDAATVSGFEGATRQCYSGNEVGGFGGGRPDGNFDRNNMPQGDVGHLEFGENGRPAGGMPDGGFGGQRPEGGPNGQMPQGDFSGMPGGFGQQQPIGATCQYASDFKLVETVNAFSGVTDYRHDLQEKGGAYVCSTCGGTFEDADGTVAVKGGIDIPWSHIICCVSGAAFATAVYTVILLLKKRKGAQKTK